MLEQQELPLTEKVFMEVQSLWKTSAGLKTLCLNQPPDFNRNYMLVAEFYGTNKTIREKK